MPLSVPFYCFCPERPDTIPGSLRLDFGYVNADEAFKVWGTFASKNCRTPEDLLRELAGSAHALMLPSGRAVPDKKVRVHPTLLWYGLRVLSHYRASEACSVIKRAAAFLYESGRMLDVRIANFLDPGFDTGDVRKLVDSPHKRPWHELRRMDAAGICAAGGCAWTSFCADPANSLELRGVGIALDERTHASSDDGRIKRAAYLWVRQCIDARLEIAAPVAYSIPGIRKAMMVMAAEENDTRLDLCVKEPLVASVRDDRGHQLLALRPADGYVWVSSMLDSSGRSLDDFKAAHEVYLDTLALTLGMGDLRENTPAREHLFKWGPGPFDAAQGGWWAHIGVLIKVASWVDTRFEVACHQITFMFLTGQMTTDHSRNAAASIAHQLGIRMPELAEDSGPDKAELMAELRAADVHGEHARREASELRAAVKSLRAEVEDLSETVKYLSKENREMKHEAITHLTKIGDQNKLVAYHKQLIEALKVELKNREG